MSAVGLYNSNRVFRIQDCPFDAQELACPLYMYLEKKDNEIILGFQYNIFINIINIWKYH